MNRDAPDAAFEAGDVVKFRGHKYEVEQVDVAPVSGGVIQYRVTPVDGGPPATLKPKDSGEAFVATQFYEVAPSLCESVSSQSEDAVNASAPQTREGSATSSADAENDVDPEVVE